MSIMQPLLTRTHPRVCLLIGTLGLGGTEQQVALLARGLHERGVPVHVVTLCGTGPREQILRDAGVPVTDLALRAPTSKAGSVFTALSASFRLARFLRRERPEVLHAFLFMSYVLAPFANIFSRVPVIVAGRRSLGDFKQDRPLALMAERLATRHTRLLIANAQAVARDTMERESLPASKIVVVYNGLPESAFAPADPTPLDGCAGPVIVCVANLRAHKGHRFLLQAAATLKERGRPLTLVLIGDGDARSDLEAMAARFGLDARFMGHRTDVRRFLARADIAVLPSLTEGMSNSVMEAMAAGLPIVATDTGGTAELIEGRGILVPPGQDEPLAAALESLLDNPSHGARLGRAARDFALAHLTEDAMVQRNLELYRELVDH